MRFYVWYHANEDEIKTLSVHPVDLLDHVEGEIPEHDDPVWDEYVEIKLGEHVLIFLGPL